MNLLIATGTGTAFAYSAWATIAGTGLPVYFESAAVIVTLISPAAAGARARARASDAIRKLAALAPATARVCGTASRVRFRPRRWRRETS